MTIIWLLISLALAAVAVTFTLQNNHLVQVDFLRFTFTQSVGVLLLLGFLAGLLAATTFYLPLHIRNHWRIRRHSKGMHALEQQLATERGRREYLEQHPGASRNTQELAEAEHTPTSVDN